MSVGQQIPTSSSGRLAPKKNKHLPNHRLIKKHRSYTVQEVEATLTVHKNTVRQWIKDGLPVIDRRRPTLILGRELIAFLISRRLKRKQPCRDGEMYCFRCRKPAPPAAKMVDFFPLTDKTGNVTGLCSRCGSLMNRVVSLSRFREFSSEMDVAFPQALPHIREIE
jgi:hypothetical protein